MAKRGPETTSESLNIRRSNLKPERWFGQDAGDSPGEASATLPLLIIDASGQSASIAICCMSNGQLTAWEVFIPAGCVASLIAVAIEQALQAAGLQARELSAIAVANGPGSFTGLRIALATARSLAWALSIPAAGFSSLSAIAASYYAGTDRGPAVAHVLTNAYRGEWFYAQCSQERSASAAVPPAQLTHRCGEDCRMTKQEILEIFNSDATLLIAEEDLPAAEKLWLGDSPRPTLVPVRRDAASMYALAIASDFRDADVLLPRYLRGSAAEENRS